MNFLPQELDLLLKMTEEQIKKNLAAKKAANTMMKVAELLVEGEENSDLNRLSKAWDKGNKECDESRQQFENIRTKLKVLREETVKAN